MKIRVYTDKIKKEVQQKARFLYSDSERTFSTYRLCRAGILQASWECMLIIRRCTELDRTVAVKSGEYTPSLADRVSGAIAVHGPFSVLSPWVPIGIVVCVSVCGGCV